MTNAFAEFWKQKHGCYACMKVPGRHMCVGCLAKARIQWNTYVATRVTKGLCIQCPRKPKKNEQRCPKCAEANRKACKTYYHRVLKFVVKERRKEGFCFSCRTQAAEGHAYCHRCLKRQAERRAGVMQAKRPYKFLSLVPA